MNIDRHDQINDKCLTKCIDEGSVCCQKSSICYLSFPDSYSGKAEWMMLDDVGWCWMMLDDAG